MTSAAAVSSGVESGRDFPVAIFARVDCGLSVYLCACVVAAFACSMHSYLRYTAPRTHLPRYVIMSVRMADEVSTQVPADDFQALEEKVYRTIELYKSARESRAAAERDSQRLREQLEEREEEVETMRREMVQLKREREEVRGRVEKMLAQINSIAEEQVAS